MFPLHENNDALIFDDLASIGHDSLLEALLAGHDEPVPNNDIGHDSLIEELLAGHVEPMPNNDLNKVNQRSKKTRKRKASSQVNNVVQETKGVEGSKELKKVIHREVERQRRLEMSTLFASLRALLPVDYIKGKRSTTDHMNEAVRYINYMQKRSKAMRNRRDMLKNNVYVSSNNGAEGVTVNESTSVVKLNSFGDEIEILISSDEAFPLSKLFTELLGRDLQVLTCVSSRANDRTLQQIQIKANDSRRIDLMELQNHLASLIKLA